MHNKCLLMSSNGSDDLALIQAFMKMRNVRPLTHF